MNALVESVVVALSDRKSTDLTIPKNAREWVALARTVMAAVDTEVVNLSVWRSRVPEDADGADTEGWSALRGCGTIACAAGHLVNHPAFRAAGLTFESDFGPTFPAPHPAFKYMGGEAMAIVMGLTPDEGDWLFGAVQPFERVYLESREGRWLNDKEVFLARCDRWLELNRTGSR